MILKMNRKDIDYIGHIFPLFLPTMVLAIGQMEPLEVFVPNGGAPGNRIPYYTPVLNLTGAKYMRFSVKTNQDAMLLFSERYVTTIDTVTDFEYVEVSLGSSHNTLSWIYPGAGSVEYIR